MVTKAKTSWPRRPERLALGAWRLAFTPYSVAIYDKLRGILTCEQAVNAAIARAAATPGR